MIGQDEITIRIDIKKIRGELGLFYDAIAETVEIARYFVVQIGVLPFAHSGIVRIENDGRKLAVWHTSLSMVSRLMIYELTEDAEGALLLDNPRYLFDDQTKVPPRADVRALFDEPNLKSL
jgi:hypothetical protein